MDKETELGIEIMDCHGLSVYTTKTDSGLNTDKIVLPLLEKNTDVYLLRIIRKGLIDKKKFELLNSNNGKKNNFCNNSSSFFASD